MKKYIRSIAIALTLLMPLVSSTVIAQDVPESQVAWVTEHTVIPAKAQAYELILGDWLKLFKKNKYSTAISARVLEDSSYQFVLTAPNLSAIDKLNAEIENIFQKEDGQALLNRFGNATNGYDSYIIMTRPDLNYIPVNPRLKGEEKDYQHWEYLYIKTGSEAKIEEVFRKLKSITKKNKIRTSYFVGTALTGENLPFYLIISSGKSASDFWIQQEKDIKAMGEEYQALAAEIKSMLRGYDAYNTTQLRDLSYTPE